MSCNNHSCNFSYYSYCYNPCCNSFCTPCMSIPCCPPCNCDTGDTFLIGGTIYGVDGLPVGAGMSVSVDINGVISVVMTDNNGFYSFTAPSGSAVVITPQPGVGVTVSPQFHSVSPVTASNTSLNFMLSAIGSEIMLGGTIYGTSGLPVGAGMYVQVEINNVVTFFATNSSGFYSFTAPANASVRITPSLGIGVVATPPFYYLSPVTTSNNALNFSLSAV